MAPTKKLSIWLNLETGPDIRQSQRRHSRQTTERSAWELRATLREREYTAWAALLSCPVMVIRVMDVCV